MAFLSVFGLSVFGLAYISGERKAIARWKLARVEPNGKQCDLGREQYNLSRFLLSLLQLILISVVGRHAK